MRQDEQADRQNNAFPVEPVVKSEEAKREEATEAVHKAYRNPWLLLLALGGLPALGHLAAAWPGLVVGVFLGFAVIAAYPALKYK